MSWPTLAALAFGYLLGSIPFGLILTRLAGTQDIRSIGSGNIGATNVLRTGRKGLAAATLLGDMLKGTLAVLLVARWLGRHAMLRRCRRRSAPFSAICFRSGSASRAARASRPISACCSALAWPAALVFGADLARGRGAHPLFVARRADRERGDARSFSGSSASTPEAVLFLAADGAVLDHASRQHRAADQRHRGQDRPEILRRRLIARPGRPASISRL